MELGDFLRRSGPKVAARVEPVAHRAAAAMSKPLEHRAPARQIVGWLAIYTAILAACVWMYVFLRPAPPQQATDGPRIVGAGSDR